MQTYALFAERDGDRWLIRSALTLDEATARIEGMEAEGSWPEGCNAVVIGHISAAPMMYADCWEPY